MTAPLAGEPQSFPRLIAGHKSRTGVSDAELARRIGVSRQNLFAWRTTGVKALPAREHLDAFATVAEIPYEVVLDAALRDSGYLPHHAGVFDAGLNPALRASAIQFARESLEFYARSPTPGQLIIGTGAVGMLARLWLTWPDRAVQFLWDYDCGLRDADPSVAITWDQIAKALRVELGGLLALSERDAFLDQARQRLGRGRRSRPRTDA